MVDWNPVAEGCLIKLSNILNSYSYHDTSCMTLCEIKNNGLVLIYCLNNSTRGNYIIPSQEETIPNLEIFDQVGREGRF